MLDTTPNADPSSTSEGLELPHSTIHEATVLDFGELRVVGIFLTIHDGTPPKLGALRLMSVSFPMRSSEFAFLSLDSSRQDVEKLKAIVSQKDWHVNFHGTVQWLFCVWKIA